MSAYPRTRLMLVAGLIGVVGLVVLAQLIRLQLVDHAQLSESGAGTRVRETVVRPERGSIWDRTGALLVGNEPRYEVWLDKRQANSMTLMLTVAPMLGLKPDDIRARLGGEQAYVMLATNVTATVGDRVIAAQEPGLDVLSYWRRNYPEHTLAAHLLGFYTAEHKGYYGLEGFYDQRLAGVAITVTEEQDVRRNPMPVALSPEGVARPGADLVLTIDRTAQMIVEDELTRGK